MCFIKEFIESLTLAKLRPIKLFIDVGPFARAGTFSVAFGESRTFAPVSVVIPTDFKFPI